ncbi:hypothetical protein MKW92_053082 [Papaver armeniacum]|nr:hypothetical protein MKW92_053082 [Papaver armeniacum]
MDIEYQEGYIRNSRGIQLFTCRWLPFSSPKALVFLCHGYGMECSASMKGCGTRLACAGYAVIGIDYEGHGRSRGARCYIKKFSNIVNDCSSFFKSVCVQGQSKVFIWRVNGRSSCITHPQKDPTYWNGAVLVAPMCKISEKLKPHPVVVNMLTRIEEIIPKWKIVPTKDVIDSAFKDPIKREEVRNNKLIYQDKPRLKTALEMLRTSMSLEDTLNEVTLPFFVLHGEADIVTDPGVSRALYEQAGSKDKTFKLYPEMWHALTSGEPDHNIETVFSDIFSWLEKRTVDFSSSNGDHTFFNTTTTTATVGPVHQNSKNPPTSEHPSEIIEIDKQQQKTRTRGRYLCGWNGKRMHHHSAM